MSVYFNGRLCGLKPYVPGEQPRGVEYIKLNTNENPYFPSKYAVDRISADEVKNLRLYSDPDCFELRNAIADFYGISADQIMPTNGSDEALAFCFAAFGEGGVVFPDVTYGFYKVFAALFGVEYAEIPLKPDFSVDIRDYESVGKTIVIANPNAQTGRYLPLESVERILKTNKNNVVVVDEAYIDFGGESAVKLIDKYRNLVVVQTFSKSRSLAGARVGFAVACKELTDDLVRVKFSFNPYNVNRLSSAVAAEAMRDKRYFSECVNKIISSRETLVARLKEMNFDVVPSLANFVLAKSSKICGEKLYKELKSRGILVRHFDDERIREYVRITVGTDEQICELISLLKDMGA